MTTLPNTMRFLLPASIAACLLMVSLHAADKPQTIELQNIAVSDAVEAIAKQLGAEAASAIITTDPKRNAITLREEHAAAPKVRNLIASRDHKPEQLKLAMTVTSKTAAKPGAPAKERVLARPILIGLPGKPMIIAFEQNGETFQIEVQASVLKPSAPLAKTVPQVKSFRVVIDAGHGGVDKGVAAENVVEKDVTLLMAQKLKAELEQQNIQVVMTRVDDEFLSLPDRVLIAEEAKPDYFVSFHSREPGRFASSYELSYKSASSKALASALNNQIRHGLAVKDVDYKDAVQQGNFYVLREVSAPAVMVSSDLKAFADAESQDKLVHAIMTGLLSLSKTEAKN